MRGAVTTMELLEPRSLRAALQLLRDESPVVPIAGCTDVFVTINAGQSRARRYLNLWGLDELRTIKKRGKSLSIGALATYTELVGSRLVQRQIPMLVQASREVGGVQIQNRGTLGGNVANASPAGDTLPVLAVAEAVVVLRSASTTRRIAFNEFYTGYRQSVMRTDELITAIEVPEVDGTQWFRKVGTRRAQAISKVVMAAVRARKPRIALGSVAPTVVRLPETEALLAKGAEIADAQATLAREIRPIDDIRSTANYRRRVAANLLARFWRDTA